LTGVSGFHNNAVTVNPQDLAPDHSGSVFGLMNTVGAIPGKYPIRFHPGFVINISSTLGFLGVYLAGHILELTGWSAVFSTAAAINSTGWLIFIIFGSAEQIC
jgi:MFS transporter, ACS family, solute carrier family 17 (sodium-dependent inorganic phosphate cotransporter), member 9